MLCAEGKRNYILVIVLEDLYFLNKNEQLSFFINIAIKKTFTFLLLTFFYLDFSKH